MINIFFAGQKNKIRCAVGSCNSPDLASYHYFPSDKARQSLWLKACGAVQINPKFARICSNHFEQAAFKNFRQNQCLDKKVKRFLLPTAVPTLNLASSLETAAESPRSLPSPASLPYFLNTSATGTQCSDPRLKEALLKIERLEKKLAKANRLSEAKKKKIVKEYLKDVGHTDTQIRHILNPTVFRKEYSPEDVCNGLILKCMSPRAYQFLRIKHFISIPSRNTLQKWIKDFKCRPGFDNSFFEVNTRCNTSPQPS